MSAPKRVQLSRRPGYRKPEHAVVIARPGKWGNPFTLLDALTQYPSLDDDGLRGMVVAQFRDLLRAGGRIEYPNWLFWGGNRGPWIVTYPSPDEIRAELAGRDLACWCSPSVACHGDALLEFANRRPE